MGSRGGGRHAAEQGEKGSGVFDLVCCLPSGNLSWVPEHTTLCVIETRDKPEGLAGWETGSQQARSAWLLWAAGPAEGCLGGWRLETLDPRCDEQVPTDPHPAQMCPGSLGCELRLSCSGVTHHVD